ncbi:MAG: hypothetical protein LUG18_13420 [Candidatus Azobacteroides sp.]|nr:hypothetical protein [Candidatus Azobacteroides sp.]
MKKTILLSLLLSFGLSAVAQTINANFPIGKYKFSIAEADVTLLLGKNNRYYFSVKENSYYGYEEGKENHIEMKGNYHLESDTILFKSDTQYTPFSIRYKNVPDVENSKIRILVNEQYPFYLNILIGKDYSSATKIDITEIISSDHFSGSEEEDMNFLIERGDSIYLEHTSYPNNEIYVFPIPANANELAILESDNEDFSFFNFFKAYRGENNNELKIIVGEKQRKKDEISMFFITNEIDEILLRETNQISDYKEIAFFRSFSLPNPEYTNYEEEDEKEIIEITISNSNDNQDTFFSSYHTYKEALQAAKKENKYLLLYRKPAGNYPCGDPLAYLKSRLDDYNEVNEFNNYFIFYTLTDKDKNIFPDKKINYFPEIKIQTGDGEVLFEDDVCSGDIFLKKTGSDPEFTKNVLDRQYINTFLTAKNTKNSKEELKKLEAYLRLYMQVQDEDEDDISSFRKKYISEKEDSGERNIFEWNIALEKEDFIRNLDAFVLLNEQNNIYDNEETFSLIKDCLKDLRYTYPLEKDGNLASVLSYLSTAYEKNTQSAGNQTQETTSLFKTTTDYIWQYTCRKEIDARPYYYELYKKAPSTIDLIAPLMVTACFKEEEIYLQGEPVYYQLIEMFMNKIVYDNATENFNKIFDNLYDNKKTELVSVLSKFVYACEYDDYTTRKNAREQYRKIVATALNNEAWDIYQFTEIMDLEKLFRASRWAEASLELVPNEPHTLDTYAHLLYRLGRKREALEVQEKGMQFIDDLKTPEEKRTMRKAYFLIKNDTRW